MFVRINSLLELTYYGQVEQGARHSDCAIGDKIDSATGKKYSVLAQEWEIEHAKRYVYL